jgi:hypothetical protein
MITFRAFLQENQSENAGHLHVFDVDETLFRTHAKVHVMHGDKHVAALSNQEYNTHKLPAGHHYDYHEFRNADHFHKTSDPIHGMIAKFKAIHNNIKDKPNHHVIINTARADFDDKHKFLDKFRKHGIDIDRSHVYRAGNSDGGKSVAERKTDIIHHHLNTGKYKKVSLYDDSKENLNHFLGLQKHHPQVKFHAFHVQHDGHVKVHRE